MRANEVNNTTGQIDHALQQLDYNQTFSGDFVIVGGELGLNDFYTELSVLLLVVYLVVIIGNLTVFSVVMLETKLHTPMYFFLSNLSIIDIVITTSVLPKMLMVCLWNDVVISFSGCFLQLYFYLAFQSVECFVLTAMAYDRYVAICNPLRYNDIVTPRTCVILAISAWICGILLPLPNVVPASRLSYCFNTIMFWFCDFPPVIALSCVDSTFLLVQALGIASIALVFPFFLIVFSYYRIVVAICKIKSLDGRKKAFSTCSSHLIIVILFFFAHLCVYISATIKNVHPNVLILISIFNCFLTPFANPIIYSFRNKDLKTAIRKHFHLCEVLS
ncbi:olfactory receptor 6N2-like [Anguilla rostrata]|uniref:olfactory receptor 6N2-like n=1 Tax=Anguilla anguilla TaxID=7936 RepID=UPI0015B30F02|nr:olfactory receptor 6N2-like [Anguilla anguilla]